MACGNLSLSRRQIFALKSIADEASWCCVFVLATLLLLNSFKETASTITYGADEVGNEQDQDVRKGSQILERACDEIYVVGEGETLQSISDKCNDPFIVEQNPHIHDPDDVFPGLVIKITPSINPRKSVSLLKYS